MKKKLAVLLSLLLVVAMLTISCAQIQKIVDQLPDEVVDAIPGVEKTTIPEGAVKYSEAEFAASVSVAIEADDKDKLPETLVIPEKKDDKDVSEIPDNGFEDCVKLKKVTLPENMSVIGDYAFRGCTALEEINCPDYVTEIGVGAFENCTALKTITFGKNVIRVSANTFKGCTALTSAVIGDAATEIRDNAFNGCSALTSISISSNIFSIGESAFAGTALSEITYHGNYEDWEKTYTANLLQTCPNRTVHCNAGIDCHYVNGVSVD